MMKESLFKLVIFFSLLIPFSVYAGEGINYIAEEWLNLLHYDNQASVIDANSTFFLSKEGHINPKAEFEANLAAFEQKNVTALCAFPARAEYISRVTGKSFINPNCPAYEEFRQKVPMDQIFIIFAGENNTVPTSIMGHIFIKFSGISEGKLREHSFSYFATDVKTDNAKFYYDVLVSSIDGLYALTPYRKKIKDYLEVEQRPIWELELELTNEQKLYLHKHLWELKGQNVRYSFIFHNCGTGTVNILKIVQPQAINPQFYKLFETPVDYIKMLDKSGLIKNTEVIPSHEYQQKSKDGKKKSILEAKKSSQIYVGHNHNRHNLTELKFMPLYQDFYDVSKAYYDDIETKFLNFDLAYRNKFYLDKLDILNMRSIVDASQSLGLQSKYLKFAFENRLGQTNTAIKPVVEGGIGYAFAFWEQRLKPYVLPKIGYRYDQVNNFYIAPELGIIIKPLDNIKIIFSYEKYFDSRYNNRGYSEKISSNFAYLLFDQTTLYLKYHKYSGSHAADEELAMGIGYNF